MRGYRRQRAGEEGDTFATGRWAVGCRIRGAICHASSRGAALDDEGATVAEYALLLTFIAMAIVGVVGLLGGDIANAFQNYVDGF